MKTFDVIGFPINLGCDTDGTELSPNILRNKGCFTSSIHQVNDIGNLSCSPRKFIIDEKYASHSKVKFLDPILTASRPLANQVVSSISIGHVPLCIGGDHVMSFGSIAGVGLAKGIENYAVIYIDAHGDYNTEESSETGNMHGMHLSFLMGFGDPNITNYWGCQPLLEPQNIYFLGARSLDIGEKIMAQELGLHIRSSQDLNMNRPNIIIEEIFNDIKRKGISHVHLSFDVDVIDPEYAPGTGVPEDNGISPALAYELVYLCMQSGMVNSVDIVEFNPILDNNHYTEEILERLIKLILQ